MTTIVTCPSGLSGRIRGLRTREERILADRRLAKSGGQLDEILAACWEETLEQGPYTFGTGPTDWSKVLQGDRFYALLAIRIASYGPTYDFDVSCSNRECRASIPWTLDLRTLPVRTLSDEGRAAFVSGRHFEVVLPRAGRRVTFRLLTGADERRMAAQRRTAGERPLSIVLGMRIESIEGVDARDKAAFIDELEMEDVTFLLGEFDRVDCGVETEISVECPECYGITRVELPFEKGFFLPQRRKPSAAQTSSSPRPM
jgi:hypothetical protein